MRKRKSRAPAALAACSLLFLSVCWICADHLSNGRVVDRMAGLLTGREESMVRAVVPDLTGTSYRDGDMAVDPNVFCLSVTYVYSREPARQILDQTPAAGTIRKVVPGTRPAELHLTVSMGPEIHRVPELAGLSVREAEQALRSLGLDPTLRTIRITTGGSPGRVLRSYPAAGARLAAGETVLVDVVSDEPTAASVCPDMVGLSLPDAWAALLSAELSLGEVVLSSDAGPLPGTVLSQSLAPGAYLLPGTSVDLIVEGM